MAGSGFDDPAVLPPFRRVIFDEAHNVEKAASSFFSQSFSRFMILRFTNRLHRRRKGRVTGHFPALRGCWEEASSPADSRAGGGGSGEGGGAGRVVPVGLGEESSCSCDRETAPGFREAAGAALGNLSFAIREMAEVFEEAFEKIGAGGGARPKGERSAQESIVWDCRVQLSRLSGIADICDRFRNEENGRNDIFWMEALRSTRGPRGKGTERAPGDYAAGHRSPHAGGGVRADQDRRLHVRHAHSGGELFVLGGEGRASGPGRQEPIFSPSRRPSTTGSRSSWACRRTPRPPIHPPTRSFSPAS